MVPEIFFQSAPCFSATTRYIAHNTDAGELIVIDTVVFSRSIPENSISMSSSESMATQHLPSSPPILSRWAWDAGLQTPQLSGFLRRPDFLAYRTASVNLIVFDDRSSHWGKQITDSQLALTPRTLRYFHDSFRIETGYYAGGSQSNRRPRRHDPRSYGRR